MNLFRTVSGWARWNLFSTNYLVPLPYWFWIGLSRSSVAHFFHIGLALPGFHVVGPRPGLLPSFLNTAFFDRGGTIHNHPMLRCFAVLIGCIRMICRQLLTLWRFRFVCQRAEVDWISGPMASIMKRQCTAPIQRGMLFICPVSYGIRLIHIDLLQRTLSSIFGSHWMPFLRLEGSAILFF